MEKIPGQVPSEFTSGVEPTVEVPKIRPVEVVFVDVDGATGASDALASCPGFVFFDKNRHDISGLPVRNKSIAYGLPSFGFTLVKEK
ncbi:MAG: hypothetical protein UX09_C0011G0003 [Candidatus Uhrbacteria bacterium GW2011_GWE2_45_35]|uniref:Uncharacterized protein n=2 Tax=Candidatus Uhriibacteriota TaxID=1752732 RepID=A0A0G1JJP2_9BACT|nr:MAG: hypothetical protein UW63_C0007G0018 [Candidatus Uhrbacteria bacterium GW2011_GWF2_44_350]KKU08821.1 MAG: hypothetical protein UX09_C0011G0003 [Candidatus Uhrbacteria bacterium GW2011_GWE2_45_35]